MHYEGLRDREQHRNKVEKMRLWIQIASALRTSIIAIPSSFLGTHEVSGDVQIIVEDMREVADLAAPAGIQIAYEALAWGTYIDTWEQAWDVVQKVDRPNFGICLDTFNIAARVYADPTTESRKNPDAEEDMKRSIDRLVRSIDVEKIAYVQVVDAEFLSQRLTEDHAFYNEEQPARMSWSRNCRLFYGEENLGAYLPIKAILKAIVEDLGFEGWISAELFNASLTDSSTSVPQQHAQRAIESWQKILKDCSLEVPSTERPELSKSRTASEHRHRAQL